jgi:hypothetical protein
LAWAGLKWKVFLNAEVAEDTEKKTGISGRSIHMKTGDARFVGGVEMLGDGVANHGL